MEFISGFSKLSRQEKLSWLKKEAKLSAETMKVLEEHLHREAGTQEIYGSLSENTVSNFFLPLGLAPNFLINGKMMVIPMVIEESSVVAAASAGAKFWAGSGGFHARVRGNTKAGQVHFMWSGDPGDLHRAFAAGREDLLQSLRPLTHRMEQRGGGIRSMEIWETAAALPGHFKLFVRFHTADAMGANFINSVLEELAAGLISLMDRSGKKGDLEVLMSILSNYTPENLVQCYVEGETGIFEGLLPGLSAAQYAERFRDAVEIAIHDPYRAVTHNKGIFNGMDAVVLATGNDYRAVEACGHAHASRNGSYQSLSSVELSEGTFRFTLEVPFSVGTVGGLTGTHPMAAAALEILGNPSSEELMQIIASAGLANNFAAIRSLIGPGIQRGHMKLHLGNILKQLKATREEAEEATRYFTGRTVSYAAVLRFLDHLRQPKQQG
jgi:hydroxymethylglutaryl-CoA reductase